MEATVKDGATLRRCMAIGAAAILGVAALLPSPVSAHHGTAAAASIPSRLARSSVSPVLELTRNQAEHGPDDRACPPSSKNHDEHGASGCSASRSPQASDSATAGASVISASSPGHGEGAADQSLSGSESTVNRAGSSSPAGGGAAVLRPGPAPGATVTANTSVSNGAGAGGSTTLPASHPAARSSPAGRSTSSHQAPVPILPAPSQPTVLGPVPLVVPAIGNVGEPAGGALPWVWFVALGAVDLGLAAGIVVRRRRRGGAA
ncbi:MAG TPA: hypothetical protein VG520_09780 [Candidatus Dormibacteraeota bacterium]|jgi:hypothetical protein|nr:hypothetical protein [Candidatus Dormibacteraeota bacterium]